MIYAFSTGFSTRWVGMVTIECFYWWQIMFEKEAYKWTEQNISVGISMYNPSIEMYCGKAFKDGAEFGFNKANEWHYVKDGDLPKKTGEYLVYIINGYGSKSIELIQYNSSRHFWCVDCQNEVIAWKEIALPKEIE